MRWAYESPHADRAGPSLPAARRLRAGVYTPHPDSLAQVRLRPQGQAPPAGPWKSKIRRHDPRLGGSPSPPRSRATPRPASFSFPGLLGLTRIASRPLRQPDRPGGQAGHRRIFHDPGTPTRKIAGQRSIEQHPPPPTATPFPPGRNLSPSREVGQCLRVATPRIALAIAVISSWRICAWLVLWERPTSSAGPLVGGSFTNIASGPTLAAMGATTSEALIRKTRDKKPIRVFRSRRGAWRPGHDTSATGPWPTKQIAGPWNSGGYDYKFVFAMASTAIVMGGDPARPRSAGSGGD